jgi:dihydroflavonol-4-reductase
VVNPTAPVGPGDLKPTPTGRIVLDFLRGRMPAVVDTGLNLVHVRDVAEAHVLALEHGVAGQRYLLGHTEGNLTLSQIFQTLSGITGLRAPRLRLPHAPVEAFAYLDNFVQGQLLRQHPIVPLEAIRIARKRMWIDPRKAVSELGMPQRPVTTALQEAVEWFSLNGYTPKGGRQRNFPLSANA